ncbi:MAG TPA: AzlD domain-containing protein [Limnochordales bacterium]
MSPQEPVRAWLAAVVAAVGLGTYLARALPLLAALRRRGAAASGEGFAGRPGSAGASADAAGPGGRLELVAPSVMAALLVSSVLPARWGPEALAQLAAHLVALAVSWAVARLRGHLGLTVLAGMAAAWAARAVVMALR